MRRTVLIGIGIVVLAFLGLLALLWARQEQMVFFPSRGLDTTPASLGLRFEDVKLHTSDGVELSAWWVPAASPRGAVILCHGNAGTMAHRVDKLLLFHGLGLDVLSFDYRGYGESKGTPSEQGTYLDMDAAVEHLWRARGARGERTIFWGESLGGAVATEAATRHRPALLVLESTFASIRAMVHRHYPFVPGFLATRVRYDSLSRVGLIDCPVLLLHGPGDSIVPFTQAEALLAAARGPKWFARLEGDHNDGGILISPKAQALLRELLDTHLSAP
jgi:hypothetical protein